jgi:AraC-like DNA-binding protein
VLPGGALQIVIDLSDRRTTPHERFCVLEAALRQRVLRRRRMHSAVEYALNEFRRLPHIRRVSEVRKDAGLSHRRFAELFREQVGLSPKIYCRLHRFQHVVGQIAAGAAVNRSDVAIGGGFCDQAHLSNEFRAFSGITPGSYLAAERPFPNHVPLD